MPSQSKGESKTYEVNFDGLVGPTHNYSGLSHGNLASMSHRALGSNPREAVLQGLLKMKFVADLGLKQALLPPQERPHIPTLRGLGFTGTDEQILKKVEADFPELLSAVSSASSMWTANAATVSPSMDTADGKVHFTPANLIAKFHRFIETPTTALVLRKIFSDPRYFVHHDPLPNVPAFGDEGAANHTRLCAHYGGRGVEFFVYGRHGLHSKSSEPKHYPARQTFEASTSMARQHQLNPDAVVFAQQMPDAIDAGVFHNDVVGVGNQGVYFCHEQAYLNTGAVIDELKKKFYKICSQELQVIQVASINVNLAHSVQSYLFNSQLISLQEGEMALILPEECKTNPDVARYLQELLARDHCPIEKLFYLDLRQSMRNGGGPACLRLRVALTDQELKATHSNVFLNDKLFADLTNWAKKHYRDRLNLDDLADPQLLMESRRALDELTVILNLGSIYSFQK